MRIYIAFVAMAMLFASAVSALTVPQEITQEATAPNSETNHPLPLMASWTGGYVWDSQTTPTQYTPSWQITMIQEGHHILPGFYMPDWTMLDPAGSPYGSMNWPTYYEWAIKQAEAMNLPIAFLGTQWEQFLYTDTTWFNLPYAQNPNMANPTSGSPVAAVSAFGAILPWQQIGTKTTSATNQVGLKSMISYLQDWYPNPPLVIFLSNNEPNKEYWSSAASANHVEADKHYLDLYGTGQTDEFKRVKVAEGWIARYRAMQLAMKNALENTNWQNKAKFMAFAAFGPGHFGRWVDWPAFSLYNTNRIDPSPLTWDGGSPQYYRGLGGKDTQVLSPQYEAMNFDFMVKEAHQLNPGFWFELSVWNGCDYYPLSNAPTDDAECQSLIADAPTYTPDRYAGFVQFGMWLNRPRLVRDYRNLVSLLSDSQVYFDAALASVDKIYTNPTLKSFWRNGTLVENTAFTHNYQTSVPSEYSAVARNFLLDTSLDPGRPWSLTTQLPVYAIASVQGTTPNRQWLVYAYSPAQDRTGVQITIPGFQAFTAAPTIKGSFYVVDENGNVTDIGTGITTMALVGNWKFDETSGTSASDSSGTGNAGTLVGGPAWTPGIISGGLSFDGADDNVSYGSPASLDDVHSGGFTFSAWIKPNTLGVNGNATYVGSIAHKGDPIVAGGGWWIGLGTSNRLMFYYGGATAADLNRYSSNNAITLGKWQHVLVTWDGSLTATNVHLYVDGVETGYSSTVSAVDLSSDGPYNLLIGLGDTGGCGFDGLIDEVRLYSNAVTVAEGRALYDQVFPVEFFIPRPFMRVR